MHELSLASGKDHVQFLLDAVNRDVPELAPKDPKVNFSPARATGVIKLCAEKAGWGKKLPKGRGLGLAWCYSHAGHVAQAVEISVDAKKRITVHRVVVVADIGPVVDMAGAEAQAQGASVDGFSTAMGLQIPSRMAASSSRITTPIRCCAFPSRRRWWKPISSSRTSRPPAWANRRCRRWRRRWPTPSSPPPASGCGSMPFRLHGYTV